MSKGLFEGTDCMKAGKRVLFYGIGKRFEQLFLKDLTLTNKMNEYNFEVIGFMDGSNGKLNYRLVRKKGRIIIAVPIREKTFDHRRAYTTFEHIMQDYENDISEDDLSHLTEILELHDYDLDTPCGGREKFKERDLHNVENRCLHHHVFSEECLRKMFGVFNLNVVEFIGFL
jgi:hypothetical protein